MNPEESLGSVKSDIYGTKDTGKLKKTKKKNPKIGLNFNEYVLFTRAAFGDRDSSM